jgi:hypothetical protein
MSRSRRHTPIVGLTTARSDKRDKVRAHRRDRRQQRPTAHRGRGGGHGAHPVSTGRAHDVSHDLSRPQAH